ncbi:MarR family winged helix-turn-helix transcriptional regulator [Nocardia cyriacigeorgica]|uniref:MarR family winged helix-turn-helix transcriptional regulator n=1 Tax=Nocardia cyriacigeorgica TaxID=135487 RepID=UPI001E3CA540|nr:MarR family transcriptional regulator [Nocardia cyriacigeorgica]
MSTDRRKDDPSQVFRRYLSSVVLHAQAGARAVGLGATDLYALNILELSGAMTPGELGAHTGLTTGPTTRLIDRLEKAGYVRRGADPSDRRKVVVELVAQPADLDEVLAPARRKIGDIIDGYTPEQREFLFDYFAQAADAFQQAATEISAAGGCPA